MRYHYAISYSDMLCHYNNIVYDIAVLYRIRYRYDAISYAISLCYIAMRYRMLCRMRYRTAMLYTMSHAMSHAISLVQAKKKCDNLLPGCRARPRNGRFLLPAAPRALRGRLRANALFRQGAAPKAAHQSLGMGGAWSESEPGPPPVPPYPLPPPSPSESLPPAAWEATENWLYHTVNLWHRYGC